MDKRANVGIYLGGPARQWFPCLTAPVLWGDTAAVAATHTTRAVPAVDGMRTVFMNEFLQGYTRYQEARLRKRKRGINEAGTEYYYEIMSAGKPSHDKRGKNGISFQRLKTYPSGEGMGDTTENLFQFHSGGAPTYQIRRIGVSTKMGGPHDGDRKGKRGGANEGRRKREANKGRRRRTNHQTADGSHAAITRSSGSTTEETRTRRKKKDE